VAAYAAASPKSYQQHTVLTASPGQLVVLLYDGALRFLRQSAAAMRAGETERAATAVRRAEAIIDELTVTLDLEAGGELAAGLRDLYLFCRRHLGQALIARDPGGVEQVAALLGELRESWAQIATAA
jgi:flagellar protein FliS